MNGPPKEKRAPAKSALQKTTDRIYELDKEAQEQFWSEAHRLFRLYLRNGNKKHLRAFYRHLDGMLNWKGKLACLERVYAETGRSRASLMYVMRQFEDIEKNSSLSKNKKGGAQ
jgi:hypothetical protein